MPATPDPDPTPVCVGLSKADLDPDPIRQFQSWFQHALAAELAEPNAMTLATATSDGLPSARIVLLKGFDDRGFVFFTNYKSQKGRELAVNPRAALVFFWAPLDRQVRILGPVTKVSPEESEAYFRTRPVGSQIGAWASKQSRVLDNRQALDQRARELMVQYADQPVPWPPHWGGFRVFPTIMEFWQGRPNRLHDRFRYTRVSGSEWRMARLYP